MFLEGFEVYRSKYSEGYWVARSTWPQPFFMYVGEERDLVVKKARTAMANYRKWKMETK